MKRLIEIGVKILVPPFYFLYPPRGTKIASQKISVDTLKNVFERCLSGLSSSGLCGKGFPKKENTFESQYDYWKRRNAGNLPFLSLPQCFLPIYLEGN